MNTYVKALLVGVLLLTAATAVQSQTVYGSISVNTPNARIEVYNQPSRPYLGNRYHNQEYYNRREVWIPYYPAPGVVYQSQSRFYNPHYHNPELRYGTPPGVVIHQPYRIP